MHIQGPLLQQVACPVTIGVGVLGLGVASYWAKRSDEKPALDRFAAVTAAVFALQMLNYPLPGGGSGHLIGGVLAAALLGVPFAVIAMGIVLAVQAVFFGDGGINALGANFINMGLIGAGVGGALFHYLKERGSSQAMSLAVASWVSVVLGAAACSIEIAGAGLGRTLTAMVGVHALMGAGEMIITVAAVTFLAAQARSLALGAMAMAISAVVLSPWASTAPDGLEWVARQLLLTPDVGKVLPTLFTNYQVPFITSSVLSTVLAGLAGIILAAGGSALVGKLMARSS